MNVIYWPLIKPPIRDFGDRMFLLCEQKDSSRELTTGTRNALWNYIYTGTHSQSRTESRSTSWNHNQVRKEVVLGGHQPQWCVWGKWALGREAEEVLSGVLNIESTWVKKGSILQSSESFVSLSLSHLRPILTILNNYDERLIFLCKECVMPIHFFIIPLRYTTWILLKKC